MVHFEPSPHVGDWYKNTTGDTFEVVAQDDDDETLELQYYDGTVEGLDSETWKSMNPEPVEQPEDWVGSMDLSLEDRPAADAKPGTDDWMPAVDHINTDMPVK